MLIKPVLNWHKWLFFISLSMMTSNSIARIKLITLPVREQVQVQLDHQDMTIVEEERIVPLKKGSNDIDFSWYNTSIVPESIVLRVIDDNSTLNPQIISVSYPPNESALTWKVSATDHGSAKVRISYVIDNLNKKYHYIAYSNHSETEMQIMQFVKIDNSSGEAYDSAIVSTRHDQSVTLPLGMDESQQFKNLQYSSVPIKKTYTVNAAELGYRDRAQDKLNVFMHYQLHNDKSHQLGDYPLAAGKVRIFQKDNSGSSVFVGEDWAKYMSIGGETKLFIGEARDIVVKRKINRKKRHPIDGNLFNLDAIVIYEIENFKDQEIVLTIQESLSKLRNEVFSSYGYRVKNRFIEWKVGKQTDIGKLPIKKQSHADSIVYQVKLPARDKGKQVTKISKQLNIIFKNEW